MYEPLLPALGADRIVVAPDTPGFGGSDPLSGPPTIARYAEVMSAMLDALGLAEVDCVGYHTGSRIAVELALIRPDVVRHLLLIGAPVYTEEERVRQRATYAERVPLESGAHLLDEWREMLRWRGPGQSIESVMQHFAHQLIGGDRRHLGHQAAFAHDYRASLPRVRCPTLVVNPADDLQSFTRRAASLSPRVRLVERPDWGHGLVDMHAAKLAALAIAFFDDSRTFDAP
jgi:pimeloyl-ACP methyl ester carboxylesterase